MKLVVCVILVGILVDTVKAVKSKQVNLALETVLNFDKNDRKADLAVIDKVQNFLEQIKNGMRRSGRRSSRPGLTFTDFVLAAAKILKEYSDDRLEDAYVVINDESKSYINKESQFNDLFDSQDMRRFVTNQLDEVKEMPALILRRFLDAAIDIIELNKKTGIQNDFLEVGNSLYDGAGAKLKKALKNLDKMRRVSELRLEQVLKHTLRSLVFDHYANLNGKVREELINMVKHYWRAFSGRDRVKQTGLRQSNAKGPTPFRHEKRSKHGHTHKVNSPTEKPRSNKKPIEDNQSEPSSKSEMDIKVESNADNQEVFVTNTEFKKLTKTREPREKEKHQKRFNIYLNKKSYKTPKDKKANRSKNKLRGSKRHGPEKNDRTRARSQESALSENGEPDIVMGGQAIRGPVHFRNEPDDKQEEAEDKDTDGSNRSEEDSSTEEILIQHSNIVDIGLSRKTPGRLNITFVSSETYEAQNVSSDEPISIDKKSMRKSNINDTLANNPEYVNNLIENIEKQIAQVRDQVEYVKNLAQSKSSDSNEHLPTKMGENVARPDSRSGFAFRALEDSDVYKSSELETQNNTVNGTEKSTINKRTTISESTATNAVEKNPTNLKSNQSNDKSIELELNGTKETNDAKHVTHSSINKNIYLKDRDNYQANAVTDSIVNSTATATEQLPLFKY